MAHNAGSHHSDSIPMMLPLHEEGGRFGTNLPPSLSQSRDVTCDFSGQDIFSISALDPIKAIHKSTGKCLIERFLKSMSLSSQVHL